MRDFYIYIAWGCDPQSGPYYTVNIGIPRVDDYQNDGFNYVCKGGDEGAEFFIDTFDNIITYCKENNIKLTPEMFATVETWEKEEIEYLEKVGMSFNITEDTLMEAYKDKCVELLQEVVDNVFELSGIYALESLNLLDSAQWALEYIKQNLPDNSNKEKRWLS